MSDIEKARQVFEKAGLAFPTIPEKLAEQLKEQSKWVFSTRPIDVWPYLLHSYVEEAEKSEVDDYAVLCHAGHGVNSYTIHYYLVQDSLRMFLQLGWGGIYSDEGKDASRIRDCFSLADQIASVAKTIGRFQAGNHLTVVVSNFGGSYWLPPGKTRRENDKLCDDPLAVLKEVLDWVKIEGGWKMKQGEVCIIPFTKMRERFGNLQETSIATQLKMAHEAVAEDIAKDFEASVVAFEEYENCEEEFYPGGRKALIIKQPIKRSEDFAAQLHHQEHGEVQGDQSDPSLNFRYVDRELALARTTQSAKYPDGRSKRAFIRPDFLLASDVTILSELKLNTDESAFYALIQLLASVCELATNDQRRRLSRYYHKDHKDHKALPLPITRFDLYILFHNYNERSKPRKRILERTGELAKEILSFRSVADQIRRIAALDSHLSDDGKLVFERLFSHPV